MQRAASALLAVLLLLVPSSAVAAEETKPRWEMVGVGSAVFGVSYAASVFTALTQSNVTDADRSGMQALYVPVVGPFLASDLRHDERVTIPALGVAQAVGLAFVAAGFVFPRKVTVVPSAPAGSAGATLVATF